MRQLITAIAAISFTAGINAADSFDAHQGLDNPDLSPPISTQPTPSQSAGEGFDAHQGLDNPDLSPVARKAEAKAGTQGGGGESFDVHQGLDNPDLSPHLKDD